MHGANQFLTALTAVLCVAAVTTIVFHRLKQPVILGYLLAGMIVGPHLSIPIVADPAIVTQLSELGVILLMFALGLEFSFGKLLRLAPTAGITALIECSLMIWLGFAVAGAFGWTMRERIFTGAIVAISSTTIIAKAFGELKIGGKLRELVVGILIVEDLIAIILMAALTAFAAGRGLSAMELMTTVGRLGVFLVALIGIGMLVVPRAMRWIAGLQRAEVTLVASVGFAFGIALLAQTAGYSVALGAFIAGALIADSGVEKDVEHLVAPLRDIFGAVFFVSVGMMIDPALVKEHWVSIAVLTLVVVGGKMVGVSVGAFITGNGTRASVQSGMTLAQIGEFSFIIATLGLSLKVVGSFLYAVAISVSALTTLSTPFLIKRSGQFANFVDRKLPKSIQTFAALYASWVEDLGAPLPPGAVAQPFRRMIQIILVDLVVLLAIIIGTAVELRTLVELGVSGFGFTARGAKVLAIVTACLLAAPFVWGLIRNARKLGLTLAERALPASKSRLDLAAAPRRALVVSLQLACVIAIGMPVIAITQPFVGGSPVLVWMGALLVMAFVFWKSATNLEGHVRAGAQVIIEAVAREARRGRGAGRTVSSETAIDPAVLLPGLGAPLTVQLDSRSPAVGKTLAELNLRGVTGATVLALRRGDSDAMLPTAHEKLQAGDVLAIAGSHDATAAAQELLLPR